jgi:hypothetical protein
MTTLDLKLFFIKEKTIDLDLLLPPMHIWETRIVNDYHDPRFQNLDWPDSYVFLTEDMHWQKFVSFVTEELKKYYHDQNIMIGHINTRVIIIRLILDDAEDAFFKMINIGPGANGVDIMFNLD